MSAQCLHGGEESTEAFRGHARRTDVSGRAVARSYAYRTRGDETGQVPCVLGVVARHPRSATPHAGRIDCAYDRAVPTTTSDVFRVQRDSLDEIRAWAPGDVFFDTAVNTMHFELQALTGAARAPGRRARVCDRNPSRASETGRRVPLIRDLIAPGSAQDRTRNASTSGPSRVVRSSLNAYRNVFFHRGWAHGTGHFDSDGRQAAELPKMNALLVPDRTSLGGRSRPYDWTYNDGTTIDEVANEIHQGMISVVDELCANEWGTAAAPAAGRIPVDEHPELDGRTS